MAVESMKYYRGGRDSYEAVELSVLSNDGSYITTCVVNVSLLICGIKAHPCRDKDDVTLTPQQRLEILEFVQAERKKITDSYPVKTYKGWQESGLSMFDDYCFPGDKVDGAVVEHFINSVPPVLLSSTCTQAGEAYSSEQDDRSGRYRDTYTTFHQVGEDCWIYDGKCFYEENENRKFSYSQLERAIAAAKRDLIMETKGVTLSHTREAGRI